jgi:hypothetical protein
MRTVETNTDTYIDNIYVGLMTDVIAVLLESLKKTRYQGDRY